MNAFPFAALLPLRGLVVTLRFTAPARFGFFHQPALTGFLRGLLGGMEGYETDLVADAVETGRIDYLPGDRYRFALFALPGADPLLKRLLAGLRGLPERAPVRDLKVPLRDNLVLESLQDLFRLTPMQSLDRLTPFDLTALEQEAELWAQAPQACLRWLSPVRLLKPKEGRERLSGEARFCHDQEDLPFTLLAHRLHDTFADLQRRRETPAPPRPPFALSAEPAKDLFWLDWAYSDAQGNERPMGGLMGVMNLPPPVDTDPITRQLWVLGQYLGMGQMRAFGWGRYRLESLGGDFTLPRPEPVASLLTWAARQENLRTAYQEIRANDPVDLPSDEDPETEEADAWRWSDSSELAEPSLPGEAEATLERIARRLAQNTYQAPPLFGKLIPKRDGGVRPLAIPPFFDRVTQRAVAQVIAPGLESLMYRGSFGYRPGRSRLDARQSIQEAYKDGYRWVYETDVSDFFETVDRERLHHRLQALFGDDTLVEHLLAWMGAPVTYQGQSIERPRGLPQGSPLSPLMANLMLDDFDHDLAHAGFRLVRYADDLVILCRDRAQAEAAGRAVQDSLAEAGLAINPDKTRITHFEQGFRYLGYLFVNSLALDTSGADTQDEPSSPPKAKLIPPDHWVAKLAVKAARPLPADGELGPAKPVAETGAAASNLPVATQPAAPADIGDEEAAETGVTLFLTGAAASVFTRSGRLLAERDEVEILSLPWSHLGALVLIGPHHITTPALRAAMEHGVPVHFANQAGKYQGCAAHGNPGPAGVQLWLQQQSRFTDPTQAMAAARSVVAAKVAHQRELLRQRNVDAVFLADLDQLLPSLEVADAYDQLEGIEGQAAKLFFARLKHLVPTDFGFHERNRHPPLDPFNVLLSLGYSILQSHVDTALRAAGLLPWVGFYHQPRGRHPTLASDLVEPFRFLVERTALSAISRRQLQPKHFSVDAGGRVQLLPEAFKLYLGLLAERFETPITARHEDTPRTLHGHLNRQNRALIDWILGRSPHFHAWRFR